MEHRHRLYLLIAFLGTAFATQARVFMTQQQALASAFPPGAKVTRQAIFLKAEQIAAARRAAGVDLADRMLVRYAAESGGKAVGFAYFDTHRVRTLAETIMVVVRPDGTIEKVEILSFDEPSDYQPRPRWMAQFNGRKLDDDLSLKAAIRPISGASLSGKAIVNASRRILALHKAVGTK